MWACAWPDCLRQKSSTRWAHMRRSTIRLRRPTSTSSATEWKWSTHAPQTSCSQYEARVCFVSHIWVRPCVRHNGKRFRWYCNVRSDLLRLMESMRIGMMRLNPSVGPIDAGIMRKTWGSFSLDSTTYRSKDENSRINAIFFEVATGRE